MTTGVRADQSEFVPVYHPTLEVSRLSGQIKIDGELNDSGWKAAAHADNFAEHNPGDQTKPPVDTKVLITYDDNYLYVAIICDDDPSTIRATFCERDRRVGSDDNAGIMIDTYGDAQWAYELFLNPYGIQADALWSPSGGEDFTYDMIWESAGIITDSGYQVEAAIPMSSMRFPDKDEQVWKIDFWRNHPRDFRNQYSWAAYDRSDPCWPCKWGTITGIRNVKPGKGIEIMPTLVGYKAGALSGDGTTSSPYSFDNEDIDGEFSIGGKYAISSNATVEATYNPDFSQVEADADQVDVNTSFALSLEEKRPFFQEGSDLFQTIFTAVYTRSINNPDYAAKMTARLNRTSIAYLMARDNDTPMLLPFEEYSRLLRRGIGKSYSNILRIKNSIGENSHIGMLMTDRRLDADGSNTVISADGNLHLSKQFDFNFQGLVTHTAEPNEAWINERFKWQDTIAVVSGNDTTYTYEDLLFDNNKRTVKLDGEKFWGHAYWLGFYRETANSYVDISMLEKSPRYRADNGFQPENNFRRALSVGYYTLRFDEGLLESLTPSYEAAKKWNFAGDLKTQYLQLNLEGNLRLAQLHFHSLYQIKDERFGGVYFDNLYLLHTCFYSRPSAQLVYGGVINYGNVIDRDNLVIGRETSVNFWVDLMPVSRLLIESTYDYVRSFDRKAGEILYEGYILRSRWNYQFSRKLAVRLIVQYNDFSHTYDLDPLLTYRLNPFSIFYIGSTYDYGRYNRYNALDEPTGDSIRLSSRQFFMKLQYLFQI